MALLDSKQLNPRLTGSFTLSGSMVGDSSSTGSFGHLNVAGNTNLVGDLTLGGNIQIGNADTDSITISSDLTSNLTPNADSTYDIGSSAKYWRNAYIDTLTTTGNVSGSSTSTGSFGRVESRGDLYSYGNITTEGDITARQFVVSSSVTTMSIAQASGSTIFGDDSSDNHRFTGSLRVTGSLNVDKGRIFEQGTSVIDHATAMAIVFGG
jgi:cytoskeletal protein CcmA (bactofilin family)